MLTRFAAKNLNGSISCDFNLHPDINIITGKNGSGKTTVLKVIWYLLSANIERIPREVEFDVLALTTDKFHLRIAKEGSKSYKFEYKYKGETLSTSLKIEDISEEVEFVRTANDTLGHLHGSIFFPTFRRVEGGFSMRDVARTARERTRAARTQTGVPEIWLTGAGGIEAGDLIQRGFSELCTNLSLFNHTFVSSISTVDIVRLLTTKYAAISENTNRIHKQLSEEIFSLIGKYDKLSGQSQKSQLAEATSTLVDIKARVNRYNEYSEDVLRPFTTLSELVKEIFKNKGISVSENIVLGDMANAIQSQILSSGEKHMLSFLCYNAFSDNVTFFVDEPEISLHVDWQRILFPTLLRQGARNQFIVATHSPFIYSKYTDRELVLNPDRGDSPDAVA